MLTRTDTALDRPMILFQDIVKILHRSMSTVLLQNTVGFELNDGWWISSVLVGIDYPRRDMVLPPKAFVRKRSAATASRLAERRKSIVAPVESTARYKYTHLPLTRTYVSSTRQESLVGLSLEALAQHIRPLLQSCNTARPYGLTRFQPAEGREEELASSF